MLLICNHIVERPTITVGDCQRRTCQVASPTGTRWHLAWSCSQLARYLLCTLEHQTMIACKDSCQWGLVVADQTCKRTVACWCLLVPDPPPSPRPAWGQASASAGPATGRAMPAEIQLRCPQETVPLATACLLHAENPVGAGLCHAWLLCFSQST